MRPAQAKQKLEHLLETRGLRVEALGVAAGVDAMVAFYRDVRADGCDVDADRDLLRYQWGTDDRCFELALTRQFMLGDGDDDEITQLSLTFSFAPARALAALGASDRWCESPDAADELRAFIVASPAYALAVVTPIVRVALDDHVV